MATKKASLRIERVSIASLHQDPANARAHGPRNISAIKASLARWGQQKPIVIGAGDVVVAGNGTLAAAIELGWDEIDVVRTDLEGAERIAYAIADNRTAELATWEDDVLAAALQGLAEDPTFDLDATGFDEGEVDAILRDAAGVGEVSELETPEAPETPVTRAGDLWLLGPHRVLCGDSTERSTYQVLTRGERPSLMVSDPPYGVAYQDAGKSRIHGDLTQAAFPVAVACCVEVLADDARLYVFCGNDQVAMVDRVFGHCLGIRPRLNVWKKESFVLRHTGYHSQFELVCYGWKGSGGSPKFWAGDRKQSDVWECRRDSVREHPTQKPVEVCAIPIRNSSREGEIVLEPFSGSGTTLIAAHQLDRICYAIEIAPQYVDVAVKRWQNLTGEQATLDGDGRTFAEIAEERGVALMEVC